MRTVAGLSGDRGQQSVVSEGGNSAVRDKAARPRVLFLGLLFAGNTTRFYNLREHSKDDPRIQPVYGQVSGWQEGGVIERLPLLPRAIKSRLRGTLQAASVNSRPRPDAIWTAAIPLVTPHLWSQLGPLRRPLVLDTDWTLDLQESMAQAYYGRPPRQGISLGLARLRERLEWKAATLFAPWSQWAAASLRCSGIRAERIRVIPPGIDLDQWRPAAVQVKRPEGKLHVLFVGGDFRRKGGDMLLDVIRQRFTDEIVLDVVTREDVADGGPIRVHRAEANSPELKALYAQADVFALPTRADCFGIATIEAMASGLPAIVSDVGAAREIVDHGQTGWLIKPNAGELALALQAALNARQRLSAIGRAARAAAEQRFDGRRNDRAVVDAVLEAIAIEARFRRR
jgi:glycosyltransferase involved in cell wall biosynthesis